MCWTRFELCLVIYVNRWSFPQLVLNHITTFWYSHAWHTTCMLQTSTDSVLHQQLHQFLRRLRYFLRYWFHGAFSGQIGRRGCWVWYAFSFTNNDELTANFSLFKLVKACLRQIFFRIYTLYQIFQVCDRVGFLQLYLFNRTAKKHCPTSHRSVPYLTSWFIIICWQQCVLFRHGCLDSWVVAHTLSSSRLIFTLWALQNPHSAKAGAGFCTWPPPVTKHKNYINKEN